MGIRLNTTGMGSKQKSDSEESDRALHYKLAKKDPFPQVKDMLCLSNFNNA